MNRIYEKTLQKPLIKIKKMPGEEPGTLLTVLRIRHRISYLISATFFTAVLFEVSSLIR